MSIRTVVALAVLAVAAPALAQKEPKPIAAAAPKAQAELVWWGHSAFILTTPGGARIAIDPWLSNPMAPKDLAQPTALDAILITHAHFDHVGDAVELAKKTGAQVIGSNELVTILGVEKGVGGNVGGSVKVKDATIHFVEAVHSSGFGQDPKTLRYGGDALGFVIEMEGGPTIYHAGDTGVFGDMALFADRYKPAYALLPIGGHFTMDPQDAATAAKLLKAKVVVPMHFGGIPLLAGTPAELESALKAQKVSAKVLVLTAGKPQPLAR